jgi:predicted nucleotidyltransferase component of viral defense system
MIPRRYIEEWKPAAPWPENAQVEQDLIIERTLAEIFSDELLSENLAFRGGTALHKIYLKPQARYSEDIDLVQTKGETIGPVLNRLRQKLAFLESKPKIEQSKHNNTITYRFASEIAPVINMRLKVEINTREHFAVLGMKQMDFKVENSWFTGECKLPTYELEELLGTKLRALYQRRKGRDLFDLYWACQHHTINTEKLIHCYREYINFDVEHPPTQKMFITNMEEKMRDKDFTGDINVILRPSVKYDNAEAYEFVKNNILVHI